MPRARASFVGAAARPRVARSSARAPSLAQTCFRSGVSVVPSMEIVFDTVRMRMAALTASAALRSSDGSSPHRAISASYMAAALSSDAGVRCRSSASARATLRRFGAPASAGAAAASAAAFALARRCSSMRPTPQTPMPAPAPRATRLRRDIAGACAVVALALASIARHARARRKRGAGMVADVSMRALRLHL